MTVLMPEDMIRLQLKIILNQLYYIQTINDKNLTEQDLQDLQSAIEKLITNL